MKFEKAFLSSFVVIFICVLNFIGWLLVYLDGAQVTSRAFTDIALMLALCGICLSLAVGHYMKKNEVVLQETSAGLTRLAKAEDQLQAIASLQEGSLKICAWSNRVQDKGEWISIGSFLHTRFGIKVSHSISEDEMRKMLTSISRMRQGKTRRADLPGDLFR